MGQCIETVHETDSQPCDPREWLDPKCDVLVCVHHALHIQYNNFDVDSKTRHCELVSASFFSSHHVRRPWEHALMHA